MGTRLSVVYTDGNTEDIIIRPVGLVAAERQFGGGLTDEHQMEGTLWAGWFLKGKPTGSFDDWLGSLDDYSVVQETPRPLVPEPSPKESPT